MIKYHRTSFKKLLEKILPVTEKFGAGFTFPIVGSIALKHEDIISHILDYDQEIACHGFKHLNYRYLSVEQQRRDIEEALRAFRSLGVKITGFRAPYNTCPDETARILDSFGFIWEGSIGFRPQYRELRRFFRIKINGKESSFVCIPQCKWSDDTLIDIYGLSPTKIARLFIKTMKETFEDHGVIMFDLHPIRIGQQKYIGILEDILAYGEKLNCWFPKVTESVDYWLKFGCWKDGAAFCCLLTGDIDNFTLFEYLTRLF